MRSELATLEHKQTELNNEGLKAILEDVLNLEKDFRKLQVVDVNEILFLK